MIWWITGNTSSGKSTLARKMLDKKTIHLDGDAMRQCWDLGFNKDDRVENNIRIANIARLIHSQGFDIVISTICPYKKLRDRVKEITGCKFIYLTGGKTGKKYDYEKENNLS